MKTREVKLIDLAKQRQLLLRKAKEWEKGQQEKEQQQSVIDQNIQEKKTKINT